MAKTCEIPDIKPRSYYTLGEMMVNVVHKNKISGQIGLKPSDIEGILGFKVPGIELTLHYLEMDGEIKLESGMYMSPWEELGGDSQ